MPKRRSRPRSAEEIHQILADLAASGLTRRKFATDRGIALSTLHSWLAKHGRSSCRQGADLVAVGSLGSSTTMAASIEIELVSGDIVRVAHGCNAEDLRAVLEELRRC